MREYHRDRGIKNIHTHTHILFNRIGTSTKFFLIRLYSVFFLVWFVWSVVLYPSTEENRKKTIQKNVWISQAPYHFFCCCCRNSLILLIQQFLSIHRIFSSSSSSTTTLTTVTILFEDLFRCRQPTTITNQTRSLYIAVYFLGSKIFFSNIQCFYELRDFFLFFSSDDEESSS